MPVGKTDINRTIIPALCARAGVPTADVRGNITSHRARSTIASQLCNAKEPMTLFELQAWLGHQNPATTHPTKPSCDHLKTSPPTSPQPLLDPPRLARLSRGGSRRARCGPARPMTWSSPIFSQNR